METLISPIPLLTACLFVIAILGIAYLCWRTQSLHFLLRRFWLLVHGNKDIPDPRIQSFTQDQTSLYAFRLFSGTQVQSLAQAHQLIAWSEKQLVPMTTISACGDYFDLENHLVLIDKLPGKFFRAALGLWLATLIVAIGVSIFVAIAKPGLATLKATDSWIVLNEDSVERVFAWPLVTPSLERGDCQKQNSARLQATGFTPPEIQTICELFEIKEWRKHIAQIKKDQRNTFLMMAFVLVAFLYIHVRNVNKHFYARELHKKLTPTKEREIGNTTT